MAADLQPVAGDRQRTGTRRAAPCRAAAPAGRAGSVPAGRWSMPRACSGSAVTGPTQAASTSCSSACSSWSSSPRDSARESSEAAAGALVKVMASSAAGDEWRPGAGPAAPGPPGPSSGRRAPARRRRPRPAVTRRTPGSGSPCSWRAILRPETPSASSRSRTSAMDSDAGDHSSVSPAARIAPFTFGPRASSSTPRRTVEQVLAVAPAVGGLHPAAEADRGGGDRDVGRVVDQFLGGGEQLGVVGERDDPQGGRVQDGGAATAAAARRARRRGGRR